MATVCVVGARGGSKGVPGKNLRPLLGKPLIAWTLEQARACPDLDEVVVSTDSPEIARVAERYGAVVPFLRPPELASDTAAKWPVWQHALAEIERLLGLRVEIFVDLDCTNPLRDPDDISAAIRRFRETRADMVLSVCDARKNPYFNMVRERDGRLAICNPVDPPIVRRQDAPRVLDVVASIYVVSPDYLRSSATLMGGNVVGYDIGADKSLDVDSELDFLLVEFLMRRRLEERS